VNPSSSICNQSHEDATTASSNPPDWRTDP
jgi:hypothetical protein